MHRSCVPQPPLDQIHPCDIAFLKRPGISLIFVDGPSLRITGPFQTLTRPLYKHFGIDGIAKDQVLIPVLTRQLPAIISRFPGARIIVENATEADAQASLRTVSLPDVPSFPWHLKLALACTISSALRTVTPWTACVGPELSALFSELLPCELWFCGEIASVTGSQDDYDIAKHVSCVLREDLEPRATSLNQALIIAAALIEHPYASQQCYAELLFNLYNVEDKLAWFKEFVPPSRMTKLLTFSYSLQTNQHQQLCHAAHLRHSLPRPR